MIFKGQPHIMRQLAVYLPSLYSGDTKANFLITAPSGWGKTRLGLLMCNYLAGGRFGYYIPENGVVRLHPGVTVHFIDEVHLLQEPERLYTPLGSGNYNFILATNESGRLAEPLVNRCFNLIFEPYTQEALLDICRDACHYPIDFLPIIEAGHNNPREILSLLKSINLYIQQNGTPADIREVLTNFLGIEHGMDPAQRRYLRILGDVGGRASLKLLSSLLHLSEDIIQYHVEPGLLYSKRIRITGRGRELCQISE